MKQSLFMSWFCDIKRRRKLLERLTILKLFTRMDLNSTCPYTIEGTISPVMISEESIPHETDDYKLLIDKNKSNKLDLDIEKNYYLIVHDGIIYALGGTNDKPILINAGNIVQINESIINTYSPLILYKNDIENLTEDKIATTYGRYLANYYLLASVFGDKIPYQNDVWNVGKVESEISKKMIHKVINPEQCGKYIDHAYFYSSYGDIFGPTLSRKSTTSDKRLIELRKSMLADLKKQGKENDISELVKVENTLINEDKKNLENDSSMAFYGDSGKKFNIHRKRQYGTLGILETFEKTKGNYDYVPGSLSEGWNIDSFVSIANEIRKGTYERGISTANGGLKTKQMIRTLQDVDITSDDCHTKRYLTIHLTKNNIKSYVNMNMVNTDGSLTTLTDENISNYIDKTVQFRSVMYCIQPDGYCYKCSGKSFENLEFKSIGTQPIDLGSVFLKLSLKAMHGTKIDSFTVENIDDYVLT